MSWKPQNRSIGKLITVTLPSVHVPPNTQILNAWHSKTAQASSSLLSNLLDMKLAPSWSIFFALILKRLPTHRQFLWYCRCPWVMMTASYQVACLLVCLLMTLKVHIVVLKKRNGYLLLRLKEDFRIDGVGKGGRDDLHQMRLGHAFLFVPIHSIESFYFIPEFMWYTCVVLQAVNDYLKNTNNFPRKGKHCG